MGTDGGFHYLQYSALPDLRILNGFVQSLVGLYDYAALANDQTARDLFAAGDAAARVEVSTYDTGAWSLYARGSVTEESDLGYHLLLRDFLGSLCTRTAEAAYRGAASHYTTYLKVAPVVALRPMKLRAGRRGKLRFRLSKISRVSMRVVRAARVMLLRDAGPLGRGTRTLDWTPPKKPGAYTLTVSARNPAGNGAQTSGRVTASRPRRRS